MHNWLRANLKALLASKPKEGELRDAGYPTIPLYTDEHRKIVTLKRVVQEALFVIFDGEHKWDGEPPDLLVPRQLQDRAIKLPKATKQIYRLEGTKEIKSGRQGKFVAAETYAYDVSKHLYISENHPLHKVLERKLRTRLDKNKDEETAKLQIAKASRDIPNCSHMLVVFAAPDNKKVNSRHALANEAYLKEIEQARNYGLAFIILGVGKDLDVAPFMQNARMLKAGLANAAKIIPCPGCVTGDRSALEKKAREDDELEQIALARIGLELDKGIKVVPHKRTVRSVKHKASKELRRVSRILRRSQRWTSNEAVDASLMSPDNDNHSTSLPDDDDAELEADAAQSSHDDMHYTNPLAQSHNDMHYDYEQSQGGDNNDALLARAGAGGSVQSNVKSACI